MSEISPNLHKFYNTFMFGINLCLRARKSNLIPSSTDWAYTLFFITCFNYRHFFKLFWLNKYFFQIVLNQAKYFHLGLNTLFELAKFMFFCLIYIRMKTEIKNKSKRNVMFIVRQAIYTHSPAKTLKKAKTSCK